MKKVNESDSVLKKSFVVGFIVYIGKIVGFIKQAVIAWAFGANSITDIYFAADGYTSVFGQIMGSSVSPAVLTQYVRLKEDGQIERANSIVWSSFIFFSVFGLVLAVLNILFAEQVCQIIGISYSPSQKYELKFFLVALCPVMVFTSIAGVAGGYLDANNKFYPSKLCSLFFSISIIGSVFLFHEKLGLKSLLYGFLLGYFLHTVFVTVLSLRDIGFRIVNPLKNRYFGLLLQKFIPLVVGNSIVDIGLLVDKIIASALTTGSVSVLYYGQVVSNDLVNAVVITSVGTVLLPSFTKNISRMNGTKEDFSNMVGESICMVVVICCILTSLYIVEGKDLIRTFFQRGGFDSGNTDSVSSIAVCYACGFIFMAVREVLIKVHYAYQDTLTPMLNSIIGVVVNVVGSILLSKFMGVMGIALATSLSIALVAILLLKNIKKYIGHSPLTRDKVVEVLKILSSGLIVMLIGLVLHLVFNDTHYFGRLIIVGLAMIVLYGVLISALKISVALRIRDILKHRIRI